MCTAGTVAAVLDMIDMPGTKDFGAMFGNCISLDLNAPDRTTTTTPDWDAVASGVRGISFDIDAVPSTGLRIEFPSKADDVDPDFGGPNYWGATSSFPTSPVVTGTNTIRWIMTKAPVAGPKGRVFDPHAFGAIQFHVPAGPKTMSYSFCISNLKVLM